MVRDDGSIVVDVGRGWFNSLLFNQQYNIYIYLYFPGTPWEIKHVFL